MLSHRCPLALVLAALLAAPAIAGDPPKTIKVDRQPLEAQVKRVVETLELLGAPLPEADRAALAVALKEQNDSTAVGAIQAVLDTHCLAMVRIAGPNKLVTSAGPARPALAEQGWRVFLVKVDNAAGVSKVELRPDSPNALPMFYRSTGKPDPKVMSVGEAGKRFLDFTMHNTQPLLAHLSGLEVEYRVLQVYCRDAGRKEASLGFGLFQTSGKKVVQVATSNKVPYVVDSAPAVLVRLQVRDYDGTPTMASLTFRDSNGRVYPS